MYLKKLIASICLLYAFNLYAQQNKVDSINKVNLTGALKVNYQSIGMETAKLDNTTAITIFRIVQELLNNTMKHASANTAIVQLAKSDGTITVAVEDDGKGFNADLLTETHGIGWTNIKNRVDF
ncbi:ATP-binding protein [uncultured Chitinophaga sp.]|uniref:sensor histidine kinase n=1 Tax=uncultured Chitinophaga sp. TaxID=339340 RepID=UPI0025E47A52|nr:ATP-binding protein [uncultured Chitinophaga sp.]